MARKKDLEKHSLYRSLIREPRYAGLGFSFILMECSIVGSLVLMLSWQWLTLFIVLGTVLVVHPSLRWASKKDVKMPYFMTRHFKQQEYWLPHPRADRKGESPSRSIPK